MPEINEKGKKKVTIEGKKKLAKLSFINHKYILQVCHEKKTG